VPILCVQDFTGAGLLLSRCTAGCPEKTCIRTVALLLCSVDVSDLKADLMEALDALKEAVLAAMRQRVRQSSDKLIEQFQVTEVELNKASGTGEEVLALKKFIQRSQAQQEKMKEDILHNKKSIDFLVRHLMPVSQEVH
jgi:hypothetical protein